MLKKKNRLTKQNDFDKVFQKGSSSFDRIMGLKVLKNNFPENRFGVIVSNKVSKSAVERNKIKRRIREAIKLYSEEMKLGFDVVVVVLPEAKEIDFEVLKKTYLKHLKKLKLL